MRYNNYHKHDHKGNPWSLDVIVKEEDYCKRAVELGHTTVFTTNHGVQGDIFTWLDCSKRYGLKMIYGTEAYYVHNRFADAEGNRDRSNKHIIIIARNNNGVMQLNDIMSEAHDTGFYYRPRIDDELLFSLNPNDFIVTSACVAGIWQDRELLLALNRHFGKHFFIEMQAHNTDFQKRVNNEMFEFSKISGIHMIHANDSHYILPEDGIYREIFLKGKDRHYPEEDGMILDYPDSDTIIKRYIKQGIFDRKKAEELLYNTLVFDDCSEITLINDDIKLPSVSQNPIAELKDIINQKWIEERKNIPRSEWGKYLEAIRYEVEIVEKTNMANYFLIDYNVVKNGQEKYGGKLTNTGRGSAPSFYITKMLGLTDIDRVNAPITLFPTRFMSVERILGTRSLPDIDLNTADRLPFIKATEDLLGAENCAWMIAWKPLQDSSAFRVYCKGIGKNISEYDDVAKDLDAYRDSPKWKKLIEDSKRFVGVVESISESPCSMVLYNKPVRKELGLIHTKEKMCCLLDGYNCDKYKYLKNDYLSVTVWAIIKDTCELAKIKIPTIRELDGLLDDKTFKMYEEGLTCTINQADSDFATDIVKKYKPKSVSEMSAFVAIIRPGCASLLDDFINRKPYTTGVDELDNILVEGKHRMIYQELIMKYLIWLGIEETGSYDIIKKIAKKKFKEAELSELKEKLINGWRERVGTDEGFIETWTVVEQAARYSFNASHSLSYAYDSLYGAYLKSHYPLEYYTTVFNYYSDDEKRTLKLTNELKYFGITLKPIKFRHSVSNYSFDKDTNEIFKGIASIKYMNAQIADELYRLRDNKYNSFMELLYDIKEKTTINARQLKILIELDFFDEFGDANSLMKDCEIFDIFNGRSQIRKDTITTYGIDENMIKQCAGKESPKMYTHLDSRKLLLLISGKLPYNKRTLSDKIKAQIEYLGYVDIIGDEYSGLACVVYVDTKYAPKLKMYSLKNGTTLDCKIDKKTFNKNKLIEGDIVMINGTRYKPKMKRNNDGAFIPVEGSNELWIVNYKKINI
ncbi:MAG: PHP domain-containing protein [Bacteroidaceae bacterium]|nr:PHP domain-containing protein [Bacteroidaceae bacterium]